MIIGFSGHIGSGKSTYAEMFEKEVSTIGFTVVRYSLADPVKMISAIIFNYIKNDDYRVLNLDYNPGEAFFQMRDILRHAYNIKYIDEQKLMDIMTQRSLIDEFKNLKYEYEGTNSPRVHKRIGRRTMQLVGTEIGRAYNSDLWVRMAKDFYLQNSQRPGTIMLIDDVRFVNEITHLRYHLGNKHTFFIKLDTSTRVAMERLKVDSKTYDMMLNHDSEKEVNLLPVDTTIQNDTDDFESIFKFFGTDRYFNDIRTSIEERALEYKVVEENKAINKMQMLNDDN